ncbi:hypothetical protein VB265_01190 [Enterobacter sichuanensis]|uniref:hypothetical protein n=1 Tax=Enterobacter sichuanensis TaxID=2071710 RepID=UPI002B20DB5C|nr:hypothetical protein [Enterobacter sichuanensis]MEA5168162.1 hypothetical protein [Enterobacter sichuanensis]
MKDCLDIQKWTTEEPAPRDLICLSSLEIAPLLKEGHLERVGGNIITIARGSEIYGDETTFEKLKAGEVVSFNAGTTLPV